MVRHRACVTTGPLLTCTVVNHSRRTVFPEAYGPIALGAASAQILGANVKTWLDLEDRFRLLEPQLQFCRLDAQWGAAGEFWRIAGSGSPVARQEYELLSSLAGKWLEEVFSDRDSDEQALLAIADPRTRWYTLLKQSSPAFGDRSYGEQFNSDGSSAGFIYTGSLHSMGVAAANVCLALQTTHPIIERKSRWQWLHDNYLKAIIIGIILAALGGLAKLLLA